MCSLGSGFALCLWAGVVTAAAAGRRRETLQWLFLWLLIKMFFPLCSRLKYCHIIAQKVINNLVNVLVLELSVCYHLPVSQVMPLRMFSSK